MRRLTRFARILTLSAVAVVSVLAIAQPAAAALGSRTLRTGARGSDVRELQYLLRRLGYRPAVTGYFGPMTATAVRAWERRAHERADAIVTRWEVLRMRRSLGSAASNGGTAAGQPRAYVFPIRGPHSFGTSINRYGAPRSGHTHQGQDVLARMGTPLVAARHGRVSRRGSDGAGGNYLVIQADDGTDMVYMHLEYPAAVLPGRWVATGQYVGRVGQTGDATTPHLHFEEWTAHYYAGGHTFDPLPRLRAWDAVS